MEQVLIFTIMIFAYGFIGAGITLTITSSDLFKPIRNFLAFSYDDHAVGLYKWLGRILHSFISCNFCVGFWVFVELGLYIFNPIQFLLSSALVLPTVIGFSLAPGTLAYAVVLTLLNGFFGSAFGLWIINKIT